MLKTGQDYRGFHIRPHYSLCADWDVDRQNRIVDREPIADDISWYEVLDPMQNDDVWFSCITEAECKRLIDVYLKKVKMKDNKQATWDAIGD